MIKYPFNNRQRQREPSTDSSVSEDLDHSHGPSSSEYVVTDVNHASYILSGLNSLRENADFCDVILQVDGEKFSAHKIVLASFSPYFKTMFQSKYVESKQNTVHLKSIESDMMKQLLDFAYTSTIKITKSNCQNLLSAANLLQVMKVRDAACEFLESHMDTSNCLGIYCFAESHACTDLQQKAFDYALKNFWSVAQNEEFLELTADKLMELVRSDKLEVEKEELVFLAIKRWYNKKPEERNLDFHKVLETVRLPLIDPYFLHDCVESFSPITMSPECMKLIEEAKLFHLLPDRSVELLNNRTKQRNNANVVQVIVAVGGEDDKVVLRSVECFSPTSGMWYTLASLPFAISKHGLVASGKNNLYLAGGEYPDGKVSMAFWRYDPVLDIWQEMAPMTTPRSEFGLAVLDGYIYAVGGWEGSYRLDSMERYDPNSNTWTMVHKLKMAVTSAAVVAYDRMLYVAGGAVYEEGDGINCLLRYDPRTETWSELPPMLIARSGAATCVLDGYIYVIGGWHASTEYTNRVERFNVKCNRWEKVSSMNERRFRPGISVINGKIYVLGGEEGWDRYHDTIECYDPQKDEWNVSGKLLSSRSWLGCVPLKIKKNYCREK
ncbi:kelch-like protein diablo [Planococcus citri]|uniref:kelch-like protein diablo n=1 Tax=Planococcus citri TaxID=170843 RepID=UPI0031FA0354